MPRTDATAARPPGRTARLAPILWLFFLSGATSLVYQVVWTRQLTLAIGSTMVAVATVLAAFMGGLALGSAVIGGRADRVGRPVIYYGWLELLIGIYALATLLLFPALDAVYVRFAAGLDGGFWTTAALRSALACLLLLPPTILMGGTLPVIARAILETGRDGAGREMARLYAVNTAGAVAGSLAAGMILLPALGIRATLVLCGLVNAAIFLVARRIGAPAVAPLAGERAVPSERRSWPPRARLAAGALLCSGVAALIYEITWTRILTLVMGSSTYAFTVMLATFLGGIALGSALARRLLGFLGRDGGAGPSQLNALAACQVLIGICALGTATLFGWLPDAFLLLYGLAGGSFALMLLAQSALGFVIMLPATLFMGASFPIACGLVVEGPGTSGRRIGGLYALNTAGAILGSVLAGFLLVPAVGIHKTLLVAAAINLLTGLVLPLARSHGTRPAARRLIPAAAAGAVLLVLATLWQPAWHPKRMLSGPYVYAPAYRASSLDQRLAALVPLYYKDGPSATVAVVQEGTRRRLVVDGKTDAGNHRDMSTQVLLGHLPLLVSPDAEDVLVIGFASGITAGAVARHDVRTIDALEIEPAMLEASRYFESENYRILDDRRFTLIIDDARSFQRVTRKRYDLIISEPSNPWQAGSSRLFTREAFAGAARSLRPHGIFAQWMHLYRVDAASVRLVARTLRSVFPHVTLWVDPEVSDAIFLCSFEPQEIDLLRMRDLLRDRPQVRESLERIDYGQAWSILRAYLLGEEELARYAGAGPVNTDNRPLLEFSAPRSLYSHQALRSNLMELHRVSGPEPFPAVSVPPGSAGAAAALLREWAPALVEAGSVAQARGALALAATWNPGDGAALLELGELRIRGGDLGGAEEALERALLVDPDDGAIHAAIGNLYFYRGHVDRAYASLRKALTLGEDSAALRNNLAVLLSRMGRYEAAIEELGEALRLAPEDSLARENRERLRRRLQEQQ